MPQNAPPLTIAIEPAVRVAELLTLLQEDLDDPVHHLGADVTWRPPSAMRINLYCFDSVPEHLHAGVCQAVAEVAAEFAEFDLGATGTALEPTNGQPRLVTVQIGEGAETLDAVRQALQKPLAALGLRPPTEPYVPKIIVGRLRSDRDPPRLQGLTNAYAQTDYGLTTVRDICVMVHERIKSRTRDRLIDRAKLSERDSTP